MKCLTRAASLFTAHEYQALKALTTPVKIQNFLDTFPRNESDTYMSPRRVLRENKMHCIEGALLAAAALWIHGEPPLVMNLSPKYGRGDFEHVVTLYRRGERYGAISKSNHATLRWRDPIFRTPRELALSYFHEWFIDPEGEKILEQYSKPLDLSRLGVSWLTSEEELDDVAGALDDLSYYDLVPKGNWRYVRNADPMERKAGDLIEWPRSNPRT
jgi:hypothetical protein